MWNVPSEVSQVTEIKRTELKKVADLGRNLAGYFTGGDGESGDAAVGALDAGPGGAEVGLGVPRGEEWRVV